MNIQEFNQLPIIGIMRGIWQEDLVQVKNLNAN